MGKQRFVEEHIEKDISNGRWAIFERLPSERELCEEYGVSRVTLRAALQRLSGRGILEMRRGSGSYVRMVPNKKRGPRSNYTLLRERMQAFCLLMPPLLLAHGALAKSSHMDELESLLNRIGVSLRNYDMRACAQAQQAFFIAIVSVFDNRELGMAASYCLPDAKTLSHLMMEQKNSDCETLFTTLGSLMGSLRRLEGQQAVASAKHYANLLLGFIGNK